MVPTEYYYLPTTIIRCGSSCSPATVFWPCRVGTRPVCLHQAPRVPLSPPWCQHTAPHYCVRDNVYSCTVPRDPQPTQTRSAKPYPDAVATRIVPDPFPISLHSTRLHYTFCIRPPSIVAVSTYFSRRLQESIAVKNGEHFVFYYGSALPVVVSFLARRFLFYVRPADLF